MNLHMELLYCQIPKLFLAPKSTAKRALYQYAWESKYQGTNSKWCIWLWSCPQEFVPNHWLNRCCLEWWPCMRLTSLQDKRSHPDLSFAWILSACLSAARFVSARFQVSLLSVLKLYLVPAVVGMNPDLTCLFQEITKIVIFWGYIGNQWLSLLLLEVSSRALFTRENSGLS